MMRLKARFRGNPIMGIDKIVTFASGAEPEHQNPVIGAFLTLLEADIRAGQHVRSLPEDLARALLANSGYAVDLDEEIEDDMEP